MIVYTRFIRPTMPAANVLNVPAYVAPTVEKAQRRVELPTKVVPIKPQALGARLHICP